MIARRAGLAALMICTLLPIALSATGSRLVAVTGAVFVCLPLLLASALAWTGRRPGRQDPRQARALREKRIVVATCLLVVALIPVTWWPLRLAFALSKLQVTCYAKQTTIEVNAGSQERDKQIAKWNAWAASDLERGPEPFVSYPDFTQKRVGMFIVEPAYPWEDRYVTFDVKALGGETRLVRWQSNQPPALDAVPLGNGWWFVSD